MQLGKQIRQNRLRLNLTQERLAEKLNVTAQAVSKWENETAMPDISLLPELSAIFGVSIDELFETSEEIQLTRIESMLEKDSMLSREDFDYAISRLQNLLHKPEYRGRCLTLIADLYQHRSSGYASMAADYAKQALEVRPDVHDNHRILFHACKGAMGDWCCSNHTHLINYYQTFVKKNPTHLPGYMWLIDNLIEDGRLEEARNTVEQMKQVKLTYHYPMYLADIALRVGELVKAEQYWQEMLADYADNTHAWFVYGDRLAKHARYHEAIEAFQKSFSLEKAPRMTDALDSIAQIHMLLGNKAEAIKAYEELLEVLKNDWKLTEGETVDGYLQNIAQLQA